MGSGRGAAQLRVLARVRACSAVLGAAGAGLSVGQSDAPCCLRCWDTAQPRAGRTGTAAPARPKSSWFTSHNFPTRAVFFLER